MKGKGAMMTQTSDATTRNDADEREGTARGVSLVRSAEAQRAAYDVGSAESLGALLDASNKAAETLIRRLRPRAT